MQDAKTPGTAPDFIRSIIRDDLLAGRHHRVVSRFPPEPNGYLHIGHAKSICLNFGVAQEFPGSWCNMRFDDTNPAKENPEYVRAIQEDVAWLGFAWHGPVRFTSDYFEQLYTYAEELIVKGLAYVCDLNADQIRATRGTLTEPGQASPFRDRTVEENLDLFRRMRVGEFEDGSRLLRARIDMASPNINMRDPALYRIRRLTHHQTGDRWCIYPTYDYSHPISDALEGVTHSLCTLEFEDHRPLYDWILANVSVPCRPRQIEFSRLEMEYTVLSKRKLNTLVNEGYVSGWDDPRMPTLAGLRRRGYTPEAIRTFCQRIGITKSAGTVEMALLESCLREDLEVRAPRAMAVLRPLKIVLENFPKKGVEEIQAPIHPQKPEMGQRTLPFTREIYIDRNDFREEAPKQFKRLLPGGEVRLRNAYVIRCEKVIKDPVTKEIVELRCTYDPHTLSANPEGRKVRGVIHWVSASRSHAATVRLYDRLFTHADPGAGLAAGQDFTARLNADSLQVLENARLEESLGGARRGVSYQFEREGYFVLDADSTPEMPVFNRTVALKDSWARISGRPEEE
ncbi:MAG: glutamine--tRNA ligase/YqeY domain fusion protein [Magnetococcales bacterium]|nr:glutamine--tRNA ligase/YqeY domain fusion protein [Magnetococcales bacterium]